MAQPTSGDRSTIWVNGRSHTVSCAGSTPLLNVLRDDLGLSGPRFGCGSGLCGACNVVVDHRVVQSCGLPLEAVAGEVTTVEGLLATPAADALVRACEELQAFQCAYCSSGILVTASVLLEARPDAGGAEVRSALDANLCRCGAHTRILRAVEAAGRSLQR